MSARNATVIEADPFKIVVQLFRSVADDIDPAEKEKVFFCWLNYVCKAHVPIS